MSIKLSFGFPLFLAVAILVLGMPAHCQTADKNLAEGDKLVSEILDRDSYWSSDGIVAAQGLAACFYGIKAICDRLDRMITLFEKIEKNTRNCT